METKQGKSGSTGRSSSEERHELLRALRWVRDRPELAEAGRRAVETNREAFADALVADPKKLVVAARAMVEAAEKAGARKPTVMALNSSVGRLEAGSKRLDRLDYTLKAVSTLTGLRDRFEIEPVLERALADAPDEANRTQLMRMTRRIRGGLRVDLSNPGFAEGDDDDDDGCDWLCCGFTCVLCLEACIVCCGLACLFC
jgi:hypothetical protein